MVNVKGALIFGLFIITCLGLAFHSPNVNANPIPIIVQGGNPIIDNETSIYLKEEVVNISMGHIEASYTFKNLKNATVTQLIYLPFFSDWGYLEYPYLTIKSDGRYILFNQTSFNDSDYMQYPAISFELTLVSFEEKEIIANYDTDFHQASSNTYTTYSYRYLTITGRYWNHSIDYAEFNFIISKGMCDTPDFSDYEVIENEDYIIATKKYNDWRPLDDIYISWTKYHSKLLIADFSIEGYKHYVGEEIVFNPESTYYEYDPGLYSIEFEWRFGDGNSTYYFGGGNFIVNHTYHQPGTYEVKLTARSSYSYSIVDYKSKTIVVEPELNLPTENEKKEESSAFIPDLGIIPIVGIILILSIILKRKRK